MQSIFTNVRVPWSHEHRDLEARTDGKVTVVEELEDKFIFVIAGERRWRPPVRHHLGHSPDVLLRSDGKMYAGCTCGWRSRNRTKDGIASWWNHMRKEERKTYA